MATTPTHTLIAAAIAGCGGLVIGWWVGVHDASGPVVQVQGPERVVTQRVDATMPADCPAWDEGELMACRSELQALKDLSELRRLVDEGTPSPFPDDLPVAYTPAGFEATVQEALEACGIEGLELSQVDCAEYPCMAWFDGQAKALKSCDAWNAHFPNTGIASSSGMIFTEAGVRTFSSIGEWAPGHSADDNTMLRMKLRFEEGRAVLADAWGGYEPTPIEAWQHKLDHWRGLAEAGEPMADEMVQLIEESKPVD